jgi:hypothetical protein
MSNTNTNAEWTRIETQWHHACLQLRLAEQSKADYIARRLVAQAMAEEQEIRSLIAYKAELKAEIDRYHAAHPLK